MITLPLNELKAKIIQEGNLSESELNQKIKDKLDALSGLISEEGAAHIIANELGIKFDATPAPGEKIQIKNIMPGMKNITVTGKISRKYELREFQTDTRQGKVASLMLADETGVIRLVLWNDQTEKFETLNEGDVLTIKNGYVRDNQGRKEVHINENSELEVNPSGIKVAAIENTRARKKLSELNETDENVEVLATIVQVFDIRYFEIDPETGKRAVSRDGQFYSGDKLIETPGYAYVMNLFIDDGTENMRTVLWRNQIQKLLDKTDEEVLQFRTNPSEFESLKNELLGTIVKIVGRVNKNESFDRLELVANLIFKDVKPEEEINKLTSNNDKPAEQKPVVQTPIVEEKVIENTPKPDTSSAEAVEKAVMEVEEESIDELSIDDLENLN